VAVVHRANTYWQIGRNRDAIRELRRFIELAPTLNDRWRGFGELLVVQCHLGRVDPDVLRQAVQNNPDRQVYDLLVAVQRRDTADASRLVESLHAPYNAGRGTRIPVRVWCYLRAETARLNGDEAHALEYAREVIRHAPPNYTLDDREDALGDTLAAFEHHVEAAEEYRRVLRLNANRGRTRYKLARDLEAAGQSAEARREYQRFLAIWKDADRDAPEVIGAKQRLAALSPHLRD
jgi:tetratricopeptide (TPR) repeat protein